MKITVKMKTVLKLISYASVVVAILCLASCKKQNEEPTENLQYVTTELGGCNIKSDLKSYDSETKNDTVVVTVSEESVHVFVGLNFTCKSAPFETRCEIKDDIIYMYIVDAGEGYFRCNCYYTFDFVFKYQGTLNQKYKIVLIDPRIENHVVISEGTIAEDTTLKVGEITEIKSGETASNTQYGLSLRVENVNDSRCPLGVDCMLTADYVSLSVKIHLTTKNDKYDFTFVDAPEGSSVLSEKAIIIEGIKYRLMDVLPYPVWGEEQPVKTVKILVSGQSMDDSQWKLIRVQNKETSENKIYPQNSEPYIIHFKKDFTVEFPLHCNISQGTYIIGNNGYIAFDGFFPCTEKYCQGLYEWEMLVVNNLLHSKKYTISGNQLTIDCEENCLIFEKK